MIRHDHPRDQPVSFAVPSEKCILYEICYERISQPAFAVVLIEIILNPTTQISIIDLVVFQLGLPLLKHLFWNRIGEAKGDELGKTILIKVRQIATAMPIARVSSWHISHVVMIQLIAGRGRRPACKTSPFIQVAYQQCACRRDACVPGEMDHSILRKFSSSGGSGWVNSIRSCVFGWVKESCSAWRKKRGIEAMALRTVWSIMVLSRPSL